MTQADLDCSVAHATGESVATIRQLGFSVADPDIADYDPEPYDLPPQMVDWDQLDAERDVVFPRPQRALACMA